MHSQGALPNVVFDPWIGFVDVDLAKVITTWGSVKLALELSSGMPLWSQCQSTK